ncbi:MAG: ABC transporter permease [Chloroflexi bacterium]|nr:ABC transporter permease [Chloroflexota bacterium]
MTKSFWSNVAWAIGPILLGLVLTTGALLAVGADPAQAYKTMWNGAFGSPVKLGDVVLAWVPLVLASIGLLITFTAGLWNIGIEGQIVLGAVFTAWAARSLDLPSVLLIPILFVAGMVGGALWALLAGILKTYGKVHEIFGGLGLNFIATGITLYLIIGPWKLPGIASTSGTELFRKSAWLPTFTGGLAVGPIEIGVALASLVVVYLALRGTLWGLKLKAIGKNIRSAFWIGIPTNRHLLGAFALCGAFAGMAGTVQAIGVWHRLIPSISGGYGYLGILVVLLSGFQATLLAPVAFFFGAVTKGSVALPLDLQLDSSLGGVLQGIIVLLVVLSQGVRARTERSGAAARYESPVVTAPAAVAGEK